MRARAFRFGPDGGADRQSVEVRPLHLCRDRLLRDAFRVQLLIGACSFPFWALLCARPRDTIGIGGLGFPGRSSPRDDHAKGAGPLPLR